MNAPALPALLRRLVAAGCAALVLALTLFAASPRAHAWLHGPDHHDHSHHQHPHDGTDRDDTCASVRLAGGVPLAVAALAPLPPLTLAAAAPRLAATGIFLVSPRYRLQPERGPPVNRVS